MNKERLIIKNFGPIKSIDLDLGKITILIGEQASGKSTIAKVLAICRYFSYIVNYRVEIDKLHEFHSNVQFAEGLENWGIRDYLKENSEIIYINHLYKFEFKYSSNIEGTKIVKIDELIKSNFKIYTRIISKSNLFTDLLNQLKNLKQDEEKNLKSQNIEIFGFYDWFPNENFFRLNVKKVMDNPIYIPTERGIQSSGLGSDFLISKDILKNLRKLNRIIRGFQREIDIEPLSIKFENRNGIGYVQTNKNEEYRELYTGASGFQSAIPIVLASIFYKPTTKTLIIEEPEQNLFPTAQKKLIEFLVNNVNKNNHSLLITTHSPYNLTTLENLMYAQKLGTIENGKFKDEVNSIIPENYWIDNNDVNVYFLDNNGAKDLMNREEDLIDKNFIDSASGIINEDFDKLLKIELKLENNLAK